MAVAVKTPPETTSSSPYQGLAAASLAGIIYVLLGLVTVCDGIPMLWSTWTQGATTLVSDALLLLMMTAASVVIGFIGLFLLGSHVARGVRAGIFVGVGGVLLLALLTLGIGFLLESWIYNNHIFGDNGMTAGAIITIAVGVLLLLLLVRAYFRPGFQRFIEGLEAQGWFSATSYKRNQGQRVRRGTILGILALVGCGLWILGHPDSGTLKRFGDLKVSIPFTGKIYVSLANVGDETDWKHQLEQSGDEYIVRDRLSLRKDLKEFKDTHVKIKNPGDPQSFMGKPYYFAAGGVYEKEKFEEAVKKADLSPRQPPPAKPDLADSWDVPSDNAAMYKWAMILPRVPISVPFLLGVLAIWFAWRLVNLPAFADFLIATEAEMNKVSWTTRSRLFQDTIVVLVTVVLMAFFLLLADAGWGYLLRTIKVLHGGSTTPTEQKSGSKW